MLVRINAAIILLTGSCFAQEVAEISPLAMANSYEAERIKRLEMAVGFSSYDFSYTFPKQTMLETTFITYYKGVAAKDATYVYAITPDDEFNGSSGRLSIFSTWNPNEEKDNWSQWQFWITKSSGGNNGVAAGLPTESFKALFEKEAPYGNGEMTFTSAALDVGREAIIWNYGPSSNGKELWRYELRVKLVPYDKKLNYKRIVKK